MVKFYGNTFSFNVDWNTVTFAYLNRYPNPYASHVQSADTIEHKFDPETKTLKIVRLYKKINSAPSWSSVFLKNNSAYIMEEISVCFETQTLETKQRNITHTRLLVVEDSLKITSEIDQINKEFVTSCNSEGRMFSKFGYGLGSRIEGFSLKRIKENFNKSRKGLTYAIEVLKEKRRLSGTAQL
ncbi:hypothetical protein BB559_004200 [Furculomyces boomerangus]|uniref:PRELI/MSF1 domain-containing protein n=2 Tax=Harpellales TaxID=61421 RepID=A0A2T9YG25_9FUNG|nr:hypothetical protein BB559_004200 [Furculomyces boomerangus]PWA00007.1 hypothetical protein BB558_003965 [Smittium angustum]